MSVIKMDEINANGMSEDEHENIKKNSQIEYLDFPDSTHSYYAIPMPLYKKGYLKE